MFLAANAACVRLSVACMPGPGGTALKAGVEWIERPRRPKSTEEEFKIPREQGGVPGLCTLTWRRE